MQDIKDYLQKKIDRISPDNRKFNGTGATLLRFDKSDNDLDDYINSCIQSIMSSMTRSEIAGMAKLTQVSTAIGQRILSMMGDNDAPFDQRVRLGDLFIEALYSLNYINVYRDPSFSEHNREAPYVIHLESRWSELAEYPLVRSKKDLRGTFSEPQKATRACLKRDKFTKEDWADISESQHISAVTKLQSVALRINLDVLEAVKLNQDKFITNGNVQIPNEGNKKRMDDRYYEWRLEVNRAKGKESKFLDKKKENYIKEAELWNKKLIALKAQSKKTAFTYTLQKAELLKTEPEFYQSIELDYRGRFYYSESFFNFQGTDMARGLIEFTEGKPIDERGRRWLAIHTASSYNESYLIDELPEWCEEDYKEYLKDEGLDSISVDKMTMNDRANWTENNYERIKGYVNRKEIPIKAEKPVVFYACCVEWTDYLNDPTGHISRLPIQIDGSNNGWQHLGAMSKDSKTGSLVGLVPSKIQRDFYVSTAKELIKIMPDWFAEKQMPMKHIRKGISKRGSMTRAYSAGEKTMATNMYADCYQEDYTEKYGISVDDCNKLSHNLITAINRVCPGPLETMSYLQKLASFEIGTYTIYRDGKVASKAYQKIKKIIKELKWKKIKSEEELISLSDAINEQSQFESRLVHGNGSNTLRWVTPSGFYVIYENFIQRSIKCKGTINGIGRITHVAFERTEMPNVKGYMSGISPNFVHSMDAAHMAIIIDNWEGTFTAVHDAFASHASDMDELLRVTKEAFIMMYNKENYYDEIEQTMLSNSESLTVEQPSIGELDVSEIRDSDYFFA
jgi:DNA-directed RNA polymerase